MTPRMRNAFAMLLCAANVAACTTLAPVQLATDDAQQAIATGELLKPGNKVRLITTDGRAHDFAVVAIDTAEGTVEGEKESVRIADIVTVEKRKPSVGKTLGLVLGIVGQVGDLAESTMVHFFAERFPERFIEVGIAEQNMMCVAGGLAAMGKIPFLATYGAFASCRSADQMRVTVAYSNLNVKIGGAHGGISVGPDGATHQAMEEISIVRSIPNMGIVVPCDFWEAYKATVAAAKHEGPMYIRFGREDVPVVTDKGTPFTLGKAEVFAEGSDLSILACGVMVYEALRAEGAAAPDHAASSAGPAVLG